MVESSEQALAVLAAAQTTASARPDSLIVPVRTAVPDWLAEVVQAAGAQALAVDVLLEPDHVIVGEPGTERRDGWEIGAITAALSAGIRNVVGADHRRVARVRAVLDLLAAAASATAATPEVAR